MEGDRLDPAASSRAFDYQRFLRDLTSLLALPAFWSGTEPAFVLRTMFEALESLLAVDVCFGVAQIGEGERFQILRVNRQPVPVSADGWAPVVALVDAEPMGETVSTVDVQGTRLRCVRLPIGYVGEAGRIVIGSTRPGFPDFTELTTARTALGLAASGLETARVIRERDEAQRAKDEFLAMLGHELRNPLAPIVTALQLIAMKSGGVRTPELQIIERQLGHLRTLVDDLLDVSRITRGTIDLRVQRVELADVIARAVETMGPLVAERDHDLQVSVPRGLLVNADHMRLVQVVSNLLSNAAKYTPPGGRIRVVAGAAGAWITLRVIDNGSGLSADLLPRIFDPFVQGRRGLKRPEGGLGIGLAVVKRVVQAHGGAVAAHSEGPGRGSEFLVTLPAAAQAAVDQPDGSVEALDRAIVRGAPARILVVDDNRDAADLAATVLQAAGHDVTVTYTGREALQRVPSAMPDVVLLDIGLPDLDGYTLAAEIRARHPHARVHLIALTGYGQPHDRARSTAAGFSAHLVKPVDPLHLTAVVRRVNEAGLGMPPESRAGTAPSESRTDPSAEIPR